jgi:hypothetical protein
MKTIDIERRRFSRIPFKTSGHLTFPGGECAVEVLDISLKGALVGLLETVPLKVGQTCVLQAMLGEASDNETDEDNAIYMEAQVAHVKGREIGLHCVEIDLDSITHLRRLLELNLGDDAALHRDLEHLAVVPK